MDPEVPLVVPEVNPAAMLDRPKGIVANPNCSTIQVVVALKPLHDAANLKRVVVTTFQSVSGAGEKGKRTLDLELSGAEAAETPFTRRIAGNALPQIGPFDVEGWTEEERKMINEPRKILGIPGLHVAPTCVRVPVEVSHSAEMMLEFDRPLDRDQALELLAGAPGLIVAEKAEDFATAIDVAGRDEVFVGRVRNDPHRAGVLHLWVVADNLRKGAATNAVQIAEQMLATGATTEAGSARRR
jgi:aspartate-semialdehyde dehydrogenase